MRSAISLSPFRDFTRYREFSFDLGEGEIVGLIGPNGAGKSTLLNCVSGLYRPQSGAVRFGGDEVVGLKPHQIAAMGIRRTFQNLELFREATLRENVILGLAYRYRSSVLSDFLDMPLARAKRQAASDEADRIINSLGLNHVASVQVSDLPYGLQKTAELARALAGRPRLLLLDEPAAGMNPEESKKVAETVRTLRDTERISILLVEHDMRVVMTVCDRVVVLDHGEKIGEGSPAEIRRDPAVIKAYLGEPVNA